MFKPSSPYPKPYKNGHRRPRVEPLSARICRLRIARGYSVYELATTGGVFAGTIRRLESGKPADKRVLSALATALGVPLCLLVCGNHCCAERACVPARSARTRSSGDADRPATFRRRAQSGAR